MKIISWNINGIRASKTNLKTVFDSLNSDVICLQETKITRDMLDEASAIVEGYNSYFSFSRKRSGYSGTANFCKDHLTPKNAEEGLSGDLTSDEAKVIGHYGNHVNFTDDELKDLDAEGRTVITQHRVRHTDGEERDLAIINVYCPRFDPDRTDRFQYKMRFHALLQVRAEAILDSGSHVIILGDLNTTHTSLDRCDSDDGESNKRPGRLWLNQMLWEKGRDPGLIADLDKDEFIAVTPHTTGGKFVDTYRHLYPTKEGAFSNWCTLTNARSTNYGRRLDYILADVELTEKCLKSATILQDFEGSDHCPVGIELDCIPIAAKTCPPLCTKLMPEFSGKQQKLSTFFTKLTKRDLTIEKEKCGDMVETDVKKSEKDNSQESVKHDSVVSLKRAPSKEVAPSQPLKKQKTVEMKKSNPGAKQANLMSFFKGGNRKNTSRQNGKVESSINKGDKNQTGLQRLSVQRVESNGMMNVTATGSTSKYFDQSVDNHDADNNASMEHGNKNEEKESDSSTTSVKENTTKTANAWKNLLGGLGPAPLCKGHSEACVLRMVKKPGPNKGRQFYTCARGEGLKSNPEARCDFFKWVDKKKG